MSWSIEEGNATAIIKFHVISTNVLGNTTSLTSNHITLTNIVEETGLTMVYMTHHSHDRCTWQEICFIVFFFHDGLRNFCTYVFSHEAKLLCHQVDGLSIQTLVNTYHNTHTHASTDDLCHRHIHHVGKFIGCNKLGKFQHLAFSQFLILQFLHTAFSKFSLLFAVLGTLTFALIGKTSECLFYLTCYIFLIYILMRGHLTFKAVFLLLSTTLLCSLALFIFTTTLTTALIALDIIDIHLTATYAIAFLLALDF